MTSNDTAADWRARTLDQLRTIILAADAGIVEERKWVKPSNPDGVPTFSLHGIICTGETYKDKVKLTFAHGAALPDPATLFNSSLEGATRRAIDFAEGAPVDQPALTALVEAAVAFNAGKKKR